jgi:hypothetical protein
LRGPAQGRALGPKAVEKSFRGSAARQAGFGRRRSAASAACLVAPDTALPVSLSNRMTVPSSVRMQEMPCPSLPAMAATRAPGGPAGPLWPEWVAGARGGTAPAVPVACGRLTGSGAKTPGIVQAGEEDSPDESEKGVKRTFMPPALAAPCDAWPAR